MSPKRIGVILAGGSGTRFGASKPKQFMRVAGKTIIEHTLAAFQQSAHIDEIAVVIHADYCPEIERLVNINGFNKVKKVLKGGSTRNESSLAAINAYKGILDSDTKMIFHDAVRPFITENILKDVDNSLDQYEAVDVAIPATDTMIEVNEHIIQNIPDRSRLWNGQTPQGFRLGTIIKAYDLALQDPHFKATDDCGVVLKYLPNVPVYVVKGSERNIKVTYELDLFISDKLFQLKDREPQNAASFSNLSDKVLVIFGGSYGIGKDILDMAQSHNARVYSFSRSQNNVDISCREKVANALKEVYEKEGRIDYVINCAAVLNKEPLCTVDYETIEAIININTKGNIYIAKEAFPYLKESRGHLLFFTSSSYTRGRANYSIYSATKAGVVNFTQAIAEEWADFGIRINCINPERTKTPMRVRNFGQEPENTLLPSKKVAEESIKTLLSDFSGQVVYVKRKN